MFQKEKEKKTQSYSLHETYESGEKADKQQESKSVREIQTKYVNNIHCWLILNRDGFIYVQYMTC